MIFNVVNDGLLYCNFESRILSDFLRDMVKKKTPLIFWVEHYGSISEDRTSKVHFKANHPSRNIDHPYPIVAHIWYLLFLSVVTLILLIPLPLVATL